MHVFKYSPRKGTVAAKMKNQVPGDIKELRSHRLLELSNKNEKEYLNCYIGKEVDVLFEEKDGEYIKGHTQNYIMVKAKLDEENLEKICRVKVIASESESVIAE